MMNGYKNKTGVFDYSPDAVEANVITNLLEEAIEAAERTIKKNIIIDNIKYETISNIPSLSYNTHITVDLTFVNMPKPKDWTGALSFESPIEINKARLRLTRDEIFDRDDPIDIFIKLDKEKDQAKTMKLRLAMLLVLVYKYLTFGNAIFNNFKDEEKEVLTDKLMRTLGSYSCGLSF